MGVAGFTATTNHMERRTVSVLSDMGDRRFGNQANFNSTFAVVNPFTVSLLLFT